MPFFAIKGTFHVTGYSPDGDSIRFKANNKSRWNLLSGRKVKLNAKEHAQLRIEAIDTLETHYKQEHQSLDFADKATKRLFKLLGIKNVKWNDKRSKVISAADGIAGYILARMAERYGRPVCFVFDSSMGWTDGQGIHLDKAKAKKSVNFKMLRAGLAYGNILSSFPQIMKFKRRGYKLWIWKLISRVVNKSLRLITVSR